MWNRVWPIARILPPALALVTLGVSSSAVSCKGKADCKNACNHLLDVARADINTQKLPDNIKSALIDQADKARPADLDHCVDKCSSGDWNGNCLMEAQNVTAAKDCK